MNKKLSILVVSILALALSAPLLAGGEKCKMNTQDCLDAMVKSMSGRGLIGVDGSYDEAQGAYKIEKYVEGTNAQAAGLQLGDAMIAINGIKLADEAASKADMKNRAPGATVNVTVRRGTEEKTFPVTLVKITDEQMAQMIGAHMREHSSVKIAGR